jgi:hypothetical protein
MNKSLESLQNAIHTASQRLDSEKVLFAAGKDLLKETVLSITRGRPVGVVVALVKAPVNILVKCFDEQYMLPEAQTADTPRSGDWRLLERDLFGNSVTKAGGDYHLLGKDLSGNSTTKEAGPSFDFGERFAKETEPKSDEHSQEADSSTSDSIGEGSIEKDP